MERYFFREGEVVFENYGRRDWGKFSFPVWYGIPVRVKWAGFLFDFNLRGSLKRITGSIPHWPDPREIVKRTDGNELIYYSIEGYDTAFDLFKSYYLPINRKTANLFVKENPLSGPYLKKALNAFEDFTSQAARVTDKEVPERLRDFLRKVALKGQYGLSQEAYKLKSILGTSIPVLPPDTIDVDYEVIPLILSEGCTMNCGFCQFKTKGSFKRRSWSDIVLQMEKLRDFYNGDLVNYQALFAGQNDALLAGGDLLIDAAMKAYECFEFAHSFFEGKAKLYFFGDAISFLRAPESFFYKLATLPYEIFLNIGLESPCRKTLISLRKPLDDATVKKAFHKMCWINGELANICVTANFVIGDALLPSHKERIKELLAEGEVSHGKGVIYLSPLSGASSKRNVLRDLREIKLVSKIPVYLYLAQSL